MGLAIDLTGEDTATAAAKKTKTNKTTKKTKKTGMQKRVAVVRAASKVAAREAAALGIELLFNYLEVKFK